VSGKLVVDFAVVQTNISSPSATLTSATVTHLTVAADATVKDLTVTTLAANDSQFSTLTVSQHIQAKDIVASHDIISPAVFAVTVNASSTIQSDTVNANRVVASLIDTTDLTINNRNPYQLLVHSDKCVTNSTVGFQDPLPPTVLSIVGDTTTNLILIGRQFLQKFWQSFGAALEL